MPMNQQQQNQSSGQAGSQAGQSQNYTGQGTQLSERDALEMVLIDSKQSASALNTYILEANNDALRRDYMTALGDVYSQQKQVYDYMQQKGYYNVKNASSQDLNQAQQKFSSSQRQSMS